MPEKSAIARAKRDAKEGKAPTTQAGEFVREEIRHVREGKHGVRSVKQAIAIGLSKARKAGVDLPPPPNTPQETAHSRSRAARPSAKRAAATTHALRQEPKASVSKAALSQQGHESAAKRTAEQRSQSAKKAAQTRKRNKHQQAS